MWQAEGASNNGSRTWLRVEWAGFDSIDKIRALRDSKTWNWKKGVNVKLIISPLK